MTGCILDRTSVSTLNETIRLSENKEELEGCIDHERQFKMAKRSQAPGNASVLKGFFSAITSLFFVKDRKEWHFWNQ